jgi:hypothetical protein
MRCPARLSCLSRDTGVRREPAEGPAIPNRRSEPRAAEKPHNEGRLP